MSTNTSDAMVAALQPTGHEAYFVAEASEDKRRDRIAGQALADLEEFRHAIREAGSLTPRVDRFVNEMHLLVCVTKDPAVALDAMFRQLAAEKGNG